MILSLVGEPTTLQVRNLIVTCDVTTTVTTQSIHDTADCNHRLACTNEQKTHSNREEGLGRHRSTIHRVTVISRLLSLGATSPFGAWWQPQ
jgi:hypothetical protein